VVSGNLITNETTDDRTFSLVVHGADKALLSVMGNALRGRMQVLPERSTTAAPTTWRFPQREQMRRMSAEISRHPSPDVSARVGHRARPHPPLASPRLRLPSGNQSRLRALAPASAQPKLAVSEPGDTFEREADRVADAVVATAQRSCEGGCEREERGACAECAQRKAESAPPSPAANPPARPRAGGGHPLRAGIRSFMEQRMGHSFERVRLHTTGARPVWPAA
jgi:hypothetical protein